MAVSPSGHKKVKRSLKPVAHAKGKEQGIGATEEQLIYSGILGMGRKVGLGVMIVAFILYLAGVMEPKVPLDQVPNYWTLSTAEFLKVAGLKSGWAWLGMYNYGDMLNLFGIAMLCLISVVCYLAIIPSLLRKKDFTFAAIALTEIIVLVVAASGIIHISE